MQLPTSPKAFWVKSHQISDDHTFPPPQGLVFTSVERRGTARPLSALHEPPPGLLSLSLSLRLDSFGAAPTARSHRPGSSYPHGSALLSDLRERRTQCTVESHLNACKMSNQGKGLLITAPLKQTQEIPLITGVVGWGGLPLAPDLWVPRGTLQNQASTSAPSSRCGFGVVINPRSSSDLL